MGAARRSTKRERSSAPAKPRIAAPTSMTHAPPPTDTRATGVMSAKRRSAAAPSAHAVTATSPYAPAVEAAARAFALGPTADTKARAITPHTTNAQGPAAARL